MRIGPQPLKTHNSDFDLRLICWEGDRDYAVSIASAIDDNLDISFTFVMEPQLVKLGGLAGLINVAIIPVEIRNQDVLNFIANNPVDQWVLIGDCEERIFHELPISLATFPPNVPPGIVVMQIKKMMEDSLSNQTQIIRAEKIEKNSLEFINPTIERLDARMKEAKNRGNAAYLLGLLSLFTALSSALYFTVVTHVPDQHNLTMFAAVMMYEAFRGLITIGILVAISKYLFNLGKAWLTESLRNADRIHAISFGKFYLEVYGTEAKGEEIRTVFDTWNIDNKSVFADLSAHDHDPKLFEKAMELVSKSTELVKAAGEKGGKTS